MARILDILDMLKAVGIASCSQAAVYAVRHTSTGRYLSEGGAWAVDIEDALRFSTAETAHAVVERHGCERGGFAVVDLARARAA